MAKYGKSLSAWLTLRGGPWDIFWPTPDMVLVKAKLGEQLGPSQEQPGSAEAAKLWITCIFKRVAKGKARTVCLTLT